MCFNTEVLVVMFPVWENYDIAVVWLLILFYFNRIKF